MHVNLSSDAKADLRSIKDYLENKSPQGLQRVLVAIFTSIGQLEAFPFLGRYGQVEGTRELSVPRTEYRIIYTFNEPYDVQIERILHAKLKYPSE